MATRMPMAKGVDGSKEARRSAGDKRQLGKKLKRITNKLRFRFKFQNFLQKHTEISEMFCSFEQVFTTGENVVLTIHARAMC